MSLQRFSSDVTSQISAKHPTFEAVPRYYSRFSSRPQRLFLAIALPFFSFLERCSSVLLIGCVHSRKGGQSIMLQFVGNESKRDLLMGLSRRLLRIFLGQAAENFVCSCLEFKSFLSLSLPCVCLIKTSPLQECEPQWRASRLCWWNMICEPLECDKRWRHVKLSRRWCQRENKAASNWFCTKDDKRRWLIGGAIKARWDKVIKTVEWGMFDWQLIPIASLFGERSVKESK